MSGPRAGRTRENAPDPYMIVQGDNPNNTDHPLDIDSRYLRRPLFDHRAEVDDILANTLKLSSAKQRILQLRMQGTEDGQSLEALMQEIVDATAGPQRDMSNFHTLRQRIAVHSEYILFLSGFNKEYLTTKREDAWKIGTVITYMQAFMTWKVSCVDSLFAIQTLTVNRSRPRKDAPGERTLRR